MKFSSQMTCHVFVVVFASKMYSPRGHPMIMQFYYLYTVHSTYTITTIETRHVHGILSLCNLIDHIAVDHHHWVIDRLFLLSKWTNFSNNLTKCTSTEGVKKVYTKSGAAEKSIQYFYNLFFFYLNRNSLWS